MMECKKYIMDILVDYKENELFFASDVYNRELRDKCSEAAFYKTLERLTKSGELIKVSKGVYHLPMISKYGLVPISSDEIVETFIKNNSGTIIGYSLYNSLNITTQIPKVINIISSSLESQTKNIQNVNIKRVSLYYTREIERMIHALEVLQDFNNIEDINYLAFISFIKEIVEEYNDKTFEDVISNINYKKSTIAFLQEILNYFNKENNLYLYLSSFSKYNHPTMEEIYEASRTKIRV